MATTKKLMGTTAVGGGALAIEDVFSTYLYTGTGSSLTITNEIDLAGEGGLVWTKRRNSANSNWFLDTERGGNQIIRSNTTDAQFTSSGLEITSFNADGYTLGTAADINSVSGNDASWTFRKAPRFFDVVTYTGDGTTDGSKKISHNLGVTPGCVMVKRTDATGNWNVYHRETASSPETRALYLNLTNGYSTGGVWGYTLPTETDFTVGSSTTTNVNGASYVAYLFAHDPLGPSGDGSDGLIACGSYTGTGVVPGNFIELGFEPQWVMVKNADQARPWVIVDNMRGMPVDGEGPNLLANDSAGEVTNASFLAPRATGFEITKQNTYVNTSGETYIYIAIRRGPMRQPESGTEVFDATYGTNMSSTTDDAFASGFPVDFAIRRFPTGSSSVVHTRLTDKELQANTTNAESTDSFSWDSMTGLDYPSAVNFSSQFAWMFRRAPGFFDVVAYTGDSPGGVGTQVINHNLGVAPEMIIYKSRSATGGWGVLNTYLPLVSGLGQGAYLNENSAFAAAGWWGSPYVAPTSSDFLVRGSTPNASGQTYIAYLFASAPGVSKVGSYTGNGTSQTIDCGFTSGARLVLIKSTSTTGDWLIADTERGIVAGSDPYLELNTTNAEVTSEDWLDPDSSGFVVNEVSGSNANTSGVSYIFYAVA